jgi:hypothetical protein
MNNNKKNVARAEEGSRTFLLFAIITATTGFVIYKLCESERENKENQINLQGAIVKEKDKIINQLISVVLKIKPVEDSTSLQKIKEEFEEVKEDSNSKRTYRKTKEYFR